VDGGVLGSSLNSSCTLYLIAYQHIITSVSINHPLQAWINYDVNFRTKAASNPSLRWDIRDLDLWLERFSQTLQLSLTAGHVIIVVVPLIILTTVLFIPLLHTLMEEGNHLTREDHHLMKVDRFMEDGHQLTEMDHQHRQTHSNDLSHPIPTHAVTLTGQTVTVQTANLLTDVRDVADPILVKASLQKGSSALIKHSLTIVHP